jgi:hypothetical protein
MDDPALAEPAQRGPGGSAIAIGLGSFLGWLGFKQKKDKRPRIAIHTEKTKF